MANSKKAKSSAAKAAKSTPKAAATPPKSSSKNSATPPLSGEKVGALSAGNASAASHAPTNTTTTHSAPRATASAQATTAAAASSAAPSASATVSAAAPNQEQAPLAYLNTPKGHVGLNAAQFGHWVHTHYTTFSFLDFEQFFIPYREQHCMAELVAKLKEGMDAISCEYIDLELSAHAPFVRVGLADS